MYGAGVRFNCDLYTDETKQQWRRVFVFLADQKGIKLTRGQSCKLLVELKKNCNDTKYVAPVPAGNHRDGAKVLRFGHIPFRTSGALSTYVDMFLLVLGRTDFITGINQTIHQLIRNDRNLDKILDEVGHRIKEENETPNYIYEVGCGVGSKWRPFHVKDSELQARMEQFAEMCLQGLVVGLLRDDAPPYRKEIVIFDKEGNYNRVQQTYPPCLIPVHNPPHWVNRYPHMMEMIVGMQPDEILPKYDGYGYAARSVEFGLQLALSQEQRYTKAELEQMLQEKVFRPISEQPNFKNLISHRIYGYAFPIGTNEEILLQKPVVLQRALRFNAGTLGADLDLECAGVGPIADAPGPSGVSAVDADAPEDEVPPYPPPPPPPQ